ncbi:uncharacterized protein PAC_10313 [Phialocephala subalpina]|uniref:Uncharacterized protein n=1 Tax=Phialocephala subalpina TaxID=576137 RepID=A0A1L7X5W4_9HELO|nr:uncharacterized protein PAC_10313 [Phialocephala subalpina]
MHRSTGSNANGGLFKGGSIFGSKTPTRPSTSSGSSTTHSESVFSSTTSRSSTFSRKASFSSTQKSPKTPHRGRNNSTAPSNLSPERRAHSTATQYTDNHPLPGAAPSRQDLEGPKSADSFKQVAASAEAADTPGSGDSFTSTTPYSNMLVRPSTGYQSIASTNNGAPSFAPIQPPSPTLETITFQHIQETSSKRISTLDYLRKAHEGRVYWFNTLLFNKPDLQRMPYFDSRKLARRATNYLLLGLSLPTILDLNSSTPIEFLKTLNALLAEFESFQQIHPPDGSSSLSRARFPQMFKRATGTGNKGRRQSSAAEIGLPMGSDYGDSKSMNGSISSSGAGTVTSFAISETDLLPGEEYTHLLTPSLPFDPDFYETFATLCDVLIDCYTRLMSLVASPRECSPAVAEMFTKADQRVRKIIVQGVVKEFEESSRAGVKTEVAGVGKVVLGGLM